MTKYGINKVIWIAVIILIIIVAIYERLRISSRIKNAEFIIGEVVGIEEDAKGSRYVVYRFFIENTEYKGSVNIGFCKKCNNRCCLKGSKVKVRYNKNDPFNSDLVLEESKIEK